MSSSAGLVHGDFGSHNVAKFGNRWKILGISGSIDVGRETNPKRGFFHPPEAVHLKTRNVSLGEKNVGAAVVPVSADATYDIWAFGTIMYEALAGLPLSPYRSAYKAKRAMTTAELFKVGQWDERSLRKALRHINDEAALDLLKILLHPNPKSRVQSMRDALRHPYFGVEEITKSQPFTKHPSIKEAEPVSLKIYTDEFMAKMDWTDADVIEQFRTKETYHMDDVAFQEEDGDSVIDEGRNPADENITEVQETQSNDDLAPVSEQPGPYPSDGNCDASVSRPVDLEFTETRNVTNTALGNQITNPTVTEATQGEASINSAVSNLAAQKGLSQSTSTSPPPPTPVSTLPTQSMSTTKSKSKFSVKGLKSKFGKK